MTSASSFSVTANVVEIPGRGCKPAEVVVADGRITAIKPVDSQADNLFVARLHRRPRPRRELDARAQRVRPQGGGARHGGDGQRSARDRQRAGRGGRPLHARQRRAGAVQVLLRRPVLCAGDDVRNGRRGDHRGRSRAAARRSADSLPQRDDELPRNPPRRSRAAWRRCKAAHDRGKRGRRPRAGTPRRGGGPDTSRPASPPTTSASPRKRPSTSWRPAARSRSAKARPRGISTHSTRCSASSPARQCSAATTNTRTNCVLGHINLLVRRAVERGIDVYDALRAACLVPIEHYGLDVGQLRVGDPADFIEVDSLEAFNVLRTWIDGQLVAEGGSDQNSASRRAGRQQVRAQEADRRARSPFPRRPTTPRSCR